MIKDEFWRSYLRLVVGGVALSLIFELFEAVGSKFSIGYLKIIVELIAVIILALLLRKKNIIREIPVSSDGLFAITLFPIALNVWCSFAPINSEIILEDLSFTTLDLVLSVLWKQIFFIGIGTALFKKHRNFKPSVKEMLTIVSAFTFSCFVDGFNIELIQSFCVALLCLALYLKTKSLDLPISFALLHALSTQFFSYLSRTSHVMEEPYYLIIYLSNALIIFLIACGILNFNGFLPSRREYN